MKASDEDAGLYGLVEYELYNGFQSQEAPHAFRIDPEDGRICVSQDMDRERDPATYDLLVKAKDGVSLCMWNSEHTQKQIIVNTSPWSLPTGQPCFIYHFHFAFLKNFEANTMHL